jgi:hypothetical protein
MRSDELSSVAESHSSSEVNGKDIPVTGREGPHVLRHRGAHIFYTIGSHMAVRLSVLRAGRPLPPGKFPGTHFC